MDKIWFKRTSAPERKRFVRSMFNDISPTYDLLNRVMTFGIDIAWRKKSIKKLLDGMEFQAGNLFLDIACGTGDMTHMLVSMDSEANVVMLDFAEKMLQQIKKRKFYFSYQEKLLICQGDGERLPFKENTFSGAMIAFGLRNIPNTMQALQEFYRVLRPGGRLVILEISESPYTWFNVLYRLYFHKFVPYIGKLISGHNRAYSYLPQSVENFIPPEEVKDQLIKAGFSKVEASPLTLGVVHLYSGDK